MLESLKHEDLQFQELSPEEKQSRGILARLSGPIASFTKGTRNGRKYSDKLWEKAFDSPLVKEMFNNGGLPGELQHPENRSETDPTKIAIMMPEPPKKDSNGHLVASVDILDTPCGQIAYQLGKYGFKFGISSRGEGDLITDFSGEESVDPDTYTLNAFDLVLIPACEDARLQFNEGLNKTKKSKLVTILGESLMNASDADRLVMEEAIDELDIEDNIQFKSTYEGVDIYFDPQDKKYIVYGMDGDEEKFNSESNAQKYIDRFVKESLNEEQVGREETKEAENPSDLLQNKPENQQQNNMANQDIDVQDEEDAELLDEGLTPQEKMDAWHEGNRRENIKACGDRKLATYIKICKNSGYDKEANIIRQEFERRGIPKELYEDIEEDNKENKASWDTDFHRLDVAYNHNFKQFEDMEEDKDALNDFIEDLDNQHKKYTVYKHEKDPGCTVFFKESLNEDTLDDSGVSIAPVYEIVNMRSKDKFNLKNGNMIQGKDLLDYFNPYDKIKIASSPGEIDKIVDVITESLNEDISWEELNGTEQSAVEAALAELKNGSTIEDAVHGAVEMYNSANEDEEYEDEDFFMEEADYSKVLDYVKSHEGISLTEGGYGSTVKLSAPFDQGWKFTLKCRNEYIDFDSLDELISELKYRGLPLSLAEFDRNRYSLENGYIDNHYQSYATYAYPPDTLGDWYDDYDEAVRNRVIESKSQAYDINNLFVQLYNSYPEYMEQIMHKNNISETDYPDLSSVPKDIQDMLNKEFLSKIKERILFEVKQGYFDESEIPYETIQLFKKYRKSVLDEHLNEETVELAADNDGAIVEQLQNILKQNKSLEEKVKGLQEKLSVGYAKEMELKEELDAYKQRVSKLSNKTKEIKVLTEKLSKAEKKIKDNKAQAEGKISTLNESISSKEFENKDLRKDISTLNETLGKKDSLIKSLDEQLGKYKDKLNSKQADIEQLKEQYETGQKDLEQLKTQYAKKIEQQNQIIEKYQRVAKNSVKRYIESQAVRLGVKSDEIVNRLPKNYSFNDIDTICEDLQEYKFNISNLPFNPQGLNEGLKVTARNISKGLIEANPDDEITEYDLKIAEAYI